MVHGECHEWATASSPGSSAAVEFNKQCEHCVFASRVDEFVWLRPRIWTAACQESAMRTHAPVQCNKCCLRSPLRSSFLFEWLWKDPNSDLAPEARVL